MIREGIMSRHRVTRGKGAKKSPRPAAPQKAAKKKAKKPIATRSARAAAEKRSATARKREGTKGRKATLFAQAMGMCAPGYEVLVRGPLRTPGRKGLVEINGPAEKGVPAGTKCACLTLASSSCKKHPSRIKVRTGHYIVGKTRRRAVWVPKVLVDKGIITVKEDVKFRCNKMNGKAL